MKQSKMLALMAMVAGMAVSGTAMAAGEFNLGNSALRVAEQGKQVGTAVVYGSYAVAFILMFVTIFKFLSYSKDDRQTPLSTVLKYFVAAVLFTALPTLLNFGSSTLFNQDVNAPKAIFTNPS